MSESSRARLMIARPARGRVSPAGPSCVSWFLLHFGAEIVYQTLGEGAGDDGGELVEAGRAEAVEAAELGQQLARGLRADAGNLLELGVEVAPGAALAVERDGKPMRLVADLLDEME